MRVGKLFVFLIGLIFFALNSQAGTYPCGSFNVDSQEQCLGAMKNANDSLANGQKAKTGASAKIGDTAASPVSLDQNPPDMHKDIGQHVQVLFDVSQFKDLEVSYNDLAGQKNLLADCWKSRDNADYGCLEKFSTKIQSGAKMLSPILASVTMVTGTSMACSKWGEAVKVLQGAMSAYNLECGFMKGRCDTRCKDANDRMENFSSSLESICNESAAAKFFKPDGTAVNGKPVNREKFTQACTEVRGYVKTQSISTRKGSVANNKKTCESYSEQYMSGLMGLLGTVQSNRMAQRCDEDSGNGTDCAANPSAPGCKKEVTCADPSRENSPECICERNPRAPGCGAAVSSAGTSDYGNYQNEGGSRARGSVANLPPGAGGGGGADPGAPPKGNDSGAAGTAGAGGGAGGGGLAGGGGSGAGKGTDKNAASVAGSKVGDGGFSEGGGGRSMRFSGARGGDSSSKSPLNKYMPKPGDGMIGAYQPGSNPSIEITGPHGKDLFDKISDRYREIGPQMNP